MSRRRAIIVALAIGLLLGIWHKANEPRRTVVPDRSWSPGADLRVGTTADHPYLTPGGTFGLGDDILRVIPLQYNYSARTA